MVLFPSSSTFALYGAIIDSTSGSEIKIMQTSGNEEHSSLDNHDPAII